MKMESKNKLNGFDIRNCTCFYFDDIMRDVNVIRRKIM